MWQSLELLVGGLLDRSPRELVGGLMLGLAAALVGAALYDLGRRRLVDARVLLVALILGANLACMAVAAGYVDRAQRTPDGSGGLYNGFVFHGHSAEGPEFLLARRILEVADADADGLLSSDEASRAAARFIRATDRTGAGRLDADTLGFAIAPALQPTAGPPGDPHPGVFPWPR